MKRASLWAQTEAWTSGMPHTAKEPYTPVKETWACSERALLGAHTEARTWSMSHFQVCGSVLQCVAVCCSVLQTSGMPHFQVCGNVWQCVAVCCSVLQTSGMPHFQKRPMHNINSDLQHSATVCKRLQHTATHCNTQQHAATRCNTLHYTATHCNEQALWGGYG